jgi:hypothetical protein
MATPTLSLTFNDLILRVAEYLGVADYSGGTAAIPTDAHDLDLCKRVVNDGYQRFINDHNWTFLNGELVVTPDGTNFTFDLPDDFQGEMLGSFTYSTTGPVASMRETNEETIRRMRAGREVTGYPSLFAIRPKNAVTETTTTARWEVLFWPTPVSTLDPLTARYRRYPNKLTNLTDRVLAGPAHDLSVKQAAIAAAEIQRYGQAGPQEATYVGYLAASIKNDERHVPRSLGYNGDGSDGGVGDHWPSRANQVDTYNGVDV